MTPEQMNEALKEANASADKAIERAKRTLRWLHGMEILDEETVHSYFRKTHVRLRRDERPTRVVPEQVTLQTTVLVI